MKQTKNLKHQSNKQTSSLCKISYTSKFDTNTKGEPTY